MFTHSSNAILLKDPKHVFYCQATSPACMGLLNMGWPPLVKAHFIKTKSVQQWYDLHAQHRECMYRVAS